MIDPAPIEDVAPIHDAAALTQHIEVRYHARHRDQLPELIRQAQMVERVHGTAPQVPVGLAVHLQHMQGELDAHMKKEELILFPAIRRGDGALMAHPIAVMRADHDEHDRAVAHIRSLTGDLTLPDAACGTWTARYRGLGVFLEDLAQHMHLENEVLFPMFEAGTTPDE